MTTANYRRFGQGREPTTDVREDLPMITFPLNSLIQRRT